MRGITSLRVTVRGYHEAHGDGEGYHKSQGDGE